MSSKNKKFVDMVYQPMLELLDFIKDNEFKVFIVTGGGVDFMRAALSEVYGIPSDQIIGSSVKTKFIDKFNANESDVKYNGTSFILKEPELNSLNLDYEKPVNIQLHIGKVPILAVGNSDGDLEILAASPLVMLEVKRSPDSSKGSSQLGGYLEEREWMK